MKLLFWLLALLPCKILAATLGFHLVSHHMPADNYNNINPGAYWKTDAGWIAGSYRNSERSTCIYIGKEIDYQIHAMNLSLTVGIVHGYRRMQIMSMVVPALAIPIGEHWSSRIAFVPRIEKDGASVIHLMMERKF